MVAKWGGVMWVECCSQPCVPEFIVTNPLFGRERKEKGSDLRGVLTTERGGVTSHGR